MKFANNSCLKFAVNALLGSGLHRPVREQRAFLTVQRLQRERIEYFLVKKKRAAEQRRAAFLLATGEGGTLLNCCVIMWWPRRWHVDFVVFLWPVVRCLDRGTNYLECWSRFLCSTFRPMSCSFVSREKSTALKLIAAFSLNSFLFSRFPWILFFCSPWILSLFFFSLFPWFLLFSRVPWILFSFPLSFSLNSFLFSSLVFLEFFSLFFSRFPWILFSFFLSFSLFFSPFCYVPNEPHRPKKVSLTVSFVFSCAWQKSENDEGEYIPPVAKVEVVKEDGAFYTKK